MIRRRAAAAAALSVAAAVAVLVVGVACGDRPDARPPITAWRPTAGFAPLGDAEARAHVRPAPEIRPANAEANAYVPTAAELRAFSAARDEHGQTAVQRNPYLRFVTGGFSGTTDEIIQWAAWKWGIPEDWLRAVDVHESGWRQSARGDLEDVGDAATRYPAQSRETDERGRATGRVWESLGLSQVKWRADGSVGAGTEPLRWKSTAFAVDYHVATVRWLYDDPGGTRSAWGDDRYRRGDAWLSIGGWFNPYPWGNEQQRDYVATVRRIVEQRPWERPGF